MVETNGHRPCEAIDESPKKPPNGRRAETRESPSLFSSSPPRLACDRASALSGTPRWRSASVASRRTR
jgi:hypothetical protein